MLSATSAMTAALAWLNAVAPSAQLTSDSRSVGVGDVFFAYPGELADGRHYISEAVARGAAAILYEADGHVWNSAFDVPHLAMQDLKKNAGPIASAYYGHPDAGMLTVAVTGTNGKTSCAHWLGSALSRLGQTVGVIGTLGACVYRSGGHDDVQSTGNTTPDALLLQRRLAEMRGAGAQALAIEASSIGLAQERMCGMHCDIAVFTNFTRDHLDYHGDMATYEAAKTMLFDWPGLKHAVLNLDDAMGVRLVTHLKKHAPQVAIIGTTLSGSSAEGVTLLQASDIRTNATGTAFHLAWPFGSTQIKTQMIGQFNVSNMLAIIAVLIAHAIPSQDVIGTVESLTAVPGRMQQMGGHDAPLVIIDYAHTPDALEKALAALRPVAQERDGNLWCVFGCGGDRDPGKRAQMGAIATAADQIIVTSDNPRSENPADIIAQVMQGATGIEPVKSLQAIEDRASAILWAVRHAGKQDVILLAGKGHESTQEINGKKLPFLDEDHAALALATRATMKGAHS